MIGFIGTYTQGPDGRAAGIYSFTLHSTGAISDITLASPADNPSFLALAPSHQFLLTVGETEAGTISAFTIHGTRLLPLNTKPSCGSDPCHLAINPDSTHVIVSNYSSGTIAVLPIAPDGMLGDPVQVISLSGSGPVQGRQDTAHAHSCTFSPDGRHCIVCDLGSDALLVYAFIPTKTQPLVMLTRQPVQPGSGPRHLVFHPDRKHLSVTHELASSVETFSFDRGTLSPRQRLSTLPITFSGANTAAALKISPDGYSLFVSNRGHNSIATFALADDNTLTLINTTHSGGNIPRDFTPTPDGRHLLVCHQASDTLITFCRDEASDTFRQTASYPVPAGVCIALSEQD
jgi:6-phosphogluconolactonase